MNPPELLDVLWILICAGEVMLMQLGFCMLESGLVRSKNSINVAIKNLADFCVAGILYFLVGFGLMFGPSLGGWTGIPSVFSPTGGDNGFSVAFFVFQMVFCCTAATIISGAVAERMRFHGYLLISAVVSVFFYPVSGHWIWGDGGWLREIGFLDFAGSTAVHALGGWLALAAVIVIGPRHGRFTVANFRTSSHSLVTATFGVIILFFGWYGFNGGSMLGFNASVPQILLNTTLAGLSGGAAALLFSQLHYRYQELRQVLNGVLGGLVAVTACCNLIDPSEALLVGAVGGLIAFAASLLLARFRIDDVVGASAAHAFPGVWGSLCVALLGDPDLWGTGHDRWSQLGVQALGCAVIFVWAFGGGLLVFRLLNRLVPLRVPLDQEQIGLNVAEHGATTEILDLLDDMSSRRRSGHFRGRVEADPFTEVGQIASEYNLVLGKVAEEMLARESVADRLREERDRVAHLNSEMLSSIGYAKRIQEAFLPGADRLRDLFPRYGLLYLPRDVVSGDFYWARECNGDRVVAVADCTGHGVPGAFMSLIGMTFLTRIFIEDPSIDPGEALAELNRRIRRALHQDEDRSSIDGMEIALCRIGTERILFAGAGRPLWFLRPNGELEVLKGTRRPVGGLTSTDNLTYRNEQISRDTVHQLFLFTDGLPDQPNPGRRPLDTPRIREILAAIGPQSPSQTIQRIHETLIRHQDTAVQRDDITALLIEP